MKSFGAIRNEAACMVGSQYRSLRRYTAKRSLESELALIVRTVIGHKRNKVPAGASQYRSLWNIADQKVDSYCVTYQANRAEIEAQIPALKELCDLAQMPNAPKKAVPFEDFAPENLLKIGTGLPSREFLENSPSSKHRRVPVLVNPNRGE